MKQVQQCRWDPACAGRILTTLTMASGRAVRPRVRGDQYLYTLRLIQMRISGGRIAPGSPWENAYAESFHSRLRDELLDEEMIRSVAEARHPANSGGWRTTTAARRAASVT